MNSVTLPIGSISVIDKIERDIGLISGIFENAGGKSKNFTGTAKILLCNRIEDTFSVHQIMPTSSTEKFELLGIKGDVSERSLYRTIQKIGMMFPVFLDRYQDIIKKHGLVDKTQIGDFSSPLLLEYLHRNQTSEVIPYPES